jgi:hypothetical protein
VCTSVKESDLEVKALLKLAGKTLHSEGMDENANEAEDMQCTDLPPACFILNRF